ncbi:MAG: electron transfer flavoprotein-ubiquinone oxidoreductase [Legionella sp.]|nr:MAG: electron transfer flavoprotein-ubiquinone oxidoreductase [Legionella sp.]
MEHEIMEYDVVIVGAGPSGLAAAIRLKQLARDHKQNLSVCVLEKGAQIGAHTLSGAVLEPRSLQALLPDTWEMAPLSTPVTSDHFYMLSEKHAYQLPTPKPMHNKGNYILSLSELCQFLAKQAEALGCEIYPGFAASHLLFDDNHAVSGVATGDLGVDKNGDKTSNYQPGMHLKAKQTLFAEGCRGELSQELMKRFQLRLNCDPQTYAIGLKEIWTIPKEQHLLGTVVHTVGWPLSQDVYGGSFVYHMAGDKIALGLVIGLDYTNPWLNPFGELQRLKTHPMMQRLLAGGERIAYGARALNEGGWQSMPKLSFPGGVLIGDGAGFLNVPKIKGIHTAMQSGMLAAETTFELLKSNQVPINENSAYGDAVKASWITQELYAVRNIRPGFRFGLWMGLALAAFETYITRGKSPWTLHNHADHMTLRPAQKAPLIEYPKPDGVFTYDLLSSVYLSNTFHEENQPCHLKLRDQSLAISVNYQQYASPETRYCPAGVYEIIHGTHGAQLQINAQNCLHCKTCDIKDPKQNIKWTAPEGGGGPNYVSM